MDNSTPLPTPDEKTQLFVKQKQLFLQAVEQAVTNGMTHFDGATEEQFTFLLADMHNTVPTTQGIGTTDYLLQNAGYKAIIFSHQFLQAFFGQYWKEHGYQLLILERPLLYLEQFLQSSSPKQEWK